MVMNNRLWVIGQSILNKLHQFNAVKMEDIAAEAVSAPVRMFGYDIKKVVNYQESAFGAR
jgi:hypothetical protein